MAKKTHAPGQMSPAPIRSDSRPRLRPARTKAFGGVPSELAVLAAASWSFDGVLRRVRGFSRAAELESETQRPGGRSAPPSATVQRNAAVKASPAFEALNVFVRSLNGSTQGKLRALMQAGREAQALPAAVAALAEGQPVGNDAIPELFARGAAALQDLQRGHAVACATGFDLEADLALWGGAGQPDSLDERVWLRFGRELAQSRVEEWSCYAIVDGRDRLEKLYLRRGMSGWWSFAALIDRPSDRALQVPPSSARSGLSRVVVLPLQSALGRACRGDLRAVRRASLALGARLGSCRTPVRRAVAPTRQVAAAR
jgi:hypothetical protein